MKGSPFRVRASALEKALLNRRFLLDGATASVVRTAVRGYTGVHEAPFRVAFCCVRSTRASARTALSRSFANCPQALQARFWRDPGTRPNLGSQTCFGADAVLVAGGWVRVRRSAEDCTVCSAVRGLSRWVGNCQSPRLRLTG